MRSFLGTLLIDQWLIPLASLLCITFTACNNNLPIIQEEQNRPITFIQKSFSTKTGLESLDLGKTLGVLAYNLKLRENNKETFDENAIPNFMYDQLMEVAIAGQLTYSPIKYWPSNPNDKIKFFAYSPHSSEANGTITPSSATAKGYPTISYTLSEDISKQVDLLMAVTAPLNSGPVSLNFKHALTQVSFSAKYINNSSSQKVVITSMKLSGVPNKADCIFTDTGFQWTNTSVTQEYILFENKEIPIGGSFVNVTDPLYFIPLPESSTAPKLNIELTLGDNQKKTQRDLTGNWSAGKDTNYQLTIDVDKITLNAFSL